jgi:hypothetical protein
MVSVRMPRRHVSCPTLPESESVRASGNEDRQLGIDDVESTTDLIPRDSIFFPS